MYASKMIFQFPSHIESDEDQRYELRDSVESYLHNLIKFGHIWGEFVLNWTKEQGVGYAYLAHPDALNPQYYSTSTQEIVAKLKETFGSAPTWEILDDYAEVVLPNWKQEEFLYVFTHAFDVTSPVCLGSTGDPLPIYLLPLSEQEHEDAYFWMSAYRLHDQIWLYSGALEIPAFKQLVEPDTELSQTGRSICQSIERNTGIPTYYFLHLKPIVLKMNAMLE